MFSSHRVAGPLAAMAATALGVLPVSFVPGQVRAADQGEVLSVTLQYRDTDLYSPEGVAILYQRIRLATSSVCSPFENPLLEQALWRDCFNHTVAKTVATVRDERLSAYHWQRIGGLKLPRWLARSKAQTSLATR
jgi:UrcA family protein